MAALQKIRNRAGLLIGALGFALLAFILSDLFSSGTTLFNKAKDKAFVVDGDVVSTGAYFDRVEQEKLFVQVMYNKSSLSETEVEGLREQVYQEMVKEKMLNIEAERLGLAVTDEEINDMVNGEYVSSYLYGLFADPQTQQLDRNAMLSFLQMMKADLNTIPDAQKEYVARLQQQWPLINNKMKYARLEEKYTALLGAALGVSTLEAKANFEATQTNADIIYAMEPYSSVADSLVSVSDKEIKALYNERKNSYKLRSELSKIAFFTKDIVPSADDYTAVAAEMSKAHDKLQQTDKADIVVADESEDQFMDVYVSDKSLSASMKDFVANASVGAVSEVIKEGDRYSVAKVLDKIVRADSLGIEFLSVPVGVDKAKTDHLVDSLLNVVKGGKDFSALVQELVPQMAGVKDVTEAVLAQNGFSQNFINKVYAASQGELLQIEDNGMVQLVKIHKKSSPITKVKLATVVKTVTPSDRTLNSLDLEINHFVEQVKDFATFEKLAAEKGYNLIPNVTLTPNQSNLQQIAGSRSVIHWAFNHEKNEVSKFDLANQKVVAIVTDRIEGDFYPESELKDMLQAELLKDKKAEYIINNLKAKNLTTLDSYASAFGARVDTVKFVNFGSQYLAGVGAEPVFNAYSLHGEVNKQVGPVQGASGVLVFSLLNKTKQPGEFNEALAKSQLEPMLMQRGRYAIEILKQKLEVEDNRVRFY